MNKTQAAIVGWLANGQTGLSSEAMAFYLGFGIIRNEDGRFHPRDPGDFNRCLGLLNAAPSLRRKLPEMAKLSKEWKRLVKDWDRIESTLTDEVGVDWSHGRHVYADVTYAMMKDVLAGKPKASYVGKKAA